MPGFFGEQTSDAEVGLRDAGLSDFAGEPIQFPLLYLPVRVTSVRRSWGTYPIPSAILEQPPLQAASIAGEPIQFPLLYLSNLRFRLPV